MSSEIERFNRAVTAFDEANAQDPNQEWVGGVAHPKELLYAQRMSAMLDRFAPEASEALRLAARSQHIQRWKIPRSDYPMTSAGYKQWRQQLMKFHAQVAGGILRESGYDEGTIGRVESLLQKKGLKVNVETQTLEDVINLVFLEDYLVGFVAKHGEYDEAKFIDILRKTWTKMSAQGRDAALSRIKLPAELIPVIQRAVGAEQSHPIG